MKKMLGFGAMLLVSLVLSGCSSDTTSDITSGASSSSAVSAEGSSRSQVKATSKPNIYSGDKDCSDFDTHAEAQDYFEAKGGSPSNNVDKLDRDGDGIACETLP